RNAIDTRMARDFEHAILALGDDDALGAVVLTGAGKAFSGGGDLKNMGVAFDDTPAVRASSWRSSGSARCPIWARPGCCRVWSGRIRRANG
ncbi:MAG: enoyl-CoA hydratase-related protein, partial [Alphaproteobacteria bacterium]|nr:enoyl-CoA hydratase-related protein [Alphaproteobacteria bacterium]